MGTPAFAVPSLELLHRERFPIRAVVTGADKARGRGRVVSSTAIAAFARKARLPLLQPEHLRDASFLDQLTSLRADLFVVVAFRILPPEVFLIPPLGSFNLHASLLPAYRGAAPINRAIMNGETRTGVTTFLLAQKVDTGSILLQDESPINPDDDAGSLHDRLSVQGARIVLNTVRGLEQGSLVPKPQDDADASPAPKILKDDCRIDWARKAQEIHNQVRGLSPYPAASTTFRGQNLKVFRSHVTAIRATAEPGTIVVSAESLDVSTGDTLLSIDELQLEGRKRMEVREFLRGHRVEAGVRLGHD